MKSKLTAFFIREKAKSRLARETKEERLAAFCIATVQGAMLMGKVQRSSQVAEASIREALSHLKRYSTVAKRRVP
jgi:hypothetical protein